MPRFYFHTDTVKDADGTELKSVEAAKCEAIKLAGRLICDEAPNVWDNAEWTMTVSDEHGLTLFQLSIIGTEAPTMLSSRRPAFVSPPA